MGVRKTQSPLAAAAAARAGVTPFIGLPTKPKNIPGPVCRISLQKALNHDITRKIRTSEIECLFDCFEYLEINLYLNQVTPKKIRAKFYEKLPYH